jgi:glycine/sarcosine/betaine reductase complex component C subunit alpha
VKGNLKQVAQREFALARKAGLHELIQSMAQENGTMNKNLWNESMMPLGEPVTSGIAGVDIMELEKAMELVWKAGIYAESGMGCTGPVLAGERKQTGTGTVGT